MTLGDISRGDRYGRLEVLREGEPYVWQGRISHRRWICRCACGRQTPVREDVLKSGHTRSCGCLHDDTARQRLYRHGARSQGNRRTPEYNAWDTIRRRSGDVPVCRRWSAPDGRGFVAFLEDMGKRPGPTWRLVRINRARGFSPANCRWEKDVPRRGVPRRMVTYRGRERTLREAAEASGVNYALLCKRLQRGWPEREALRP
jgi:hypothetical protein